VTVQLRLVESPLKQPKRAGARSTSAMAKATATGARAKVVKPAAAAAKAAKVRRPVRWGYWQLDDRTRRIGRAGVAAARKALEEARSAQELREAS
jgi:hypothetical protein